MFNQSKKIIFGMLAFCAVATAQAQIVFPVEAPKLSLGDMWSTQMTDLWKNEIQPGLSKVVVSRADEKGYRFSTVNREGVPGGFNAGIDTIGLPYKVEGEDQQNKWLKFPLNADTKWTNNYKRVFNEVTATFTINCEVNKTEKITVPAGEFDTVKYTCKGFWNNTANNNGSLEQIIWYAPVVKRLIKEDYREWNGSRQVSKNLFELKEFKVN